MHISKIDCFCKYTAGLWRSVVICCCLLLCLETLCAQQPAYINYTVKEGMPSNTVYCIFQDKKGYLWLGTDRGVARFDGYQFTIFTTTDGLADNTIFDIYEDSKHRIWFACNNGNACYYADGVFYNRKNSRLLAQINKQGPALKTLEDKDHQLFLLTHFNIYKLSAENQISELYLNESNLYSSMSLNDKGEVVVLEAKGLRNLSTGILARFESSDPIVPQLNSKTMISRGKVYHTQLTDIVSSEWQSQTLKTELHNITLHTYMTQCILDNGNDQLLVGTQNGMYIWDQQSGAVQSHSFDRVSISGMLKDNEGNLWISSLNNGIYLSINPNIQILNSLSGLNFNYCSFIDKLADGSFVIGSNHFQMAILRDQVLHNLKLPEQFGEGKVEKIRSNSAGDFFVTLGSALMRVNSQDFSVKVFNFAARDLLFEGNDRLLLVAGNSLRQINNAKAFENYRSTASLEQIDTNITVNNVKASGLYKGPTTGKIYLYGLFGVKRYVNNHTEDLLPDNEYLSKNIYRVQETPDGLLWLASNIYGVLVICNGKLIRIDNTKGLPSNFIHAIYADSQQHIWVAGVAGLSKISYQMPGGKFEYKIDHYSRADGLISENINDVIKAGDQVYLATEEGICIFREQDLRLHAAIPVLNIEAVYFNNILQNAGPLYNSDYKHNSVKLKFAGLSYRSLGNIHYKYRMKGLEDRWSYTRNTMLEYPALVSGSYVFELVAINSKGVPSVMQSVSIYISPPFWAEWWFRLAILLLLFLLIYYLIQKRFTVIRNRHQIREQLLNLENQHLEAQKQQAEYERELSEVRHQALRLHMNPHFIFNAINSIQGFYASGEIETAKTYIGKFSGLLRMILDQSKREWIGIQEEMKTILYYLDLNTLRFDHKFSYDLQVDQSLIDANEELPPMIIQPFIENAIIHGIAPLKRMGKIVVRIYDRDKYICCEIEDNGVGRHFSFELNKGRMYESTGIQVTRKRIDLLNAQAGENQETVLFDIRDLLTDDGQAAGTKVIFYLLKNSI